MDLDQFSAEAATVAARHTSIFAQEDDDDDHVHTKRVNQWRLERDPTSGRVWLSHPAILRPLPDIENENADRATCQEEGEDEEDVEAKHGFDPAAYPSATTTAKGCAKTATTTTEWMLDVVYSDTWQSPVLYFRVQTCDGRLLYRSQVLQRLERNETGDSWEFLSQDEHPVTGAPAFFLHPCQTATRMGLVRESTQNYSSSSSSPSPLPSKGIQLLSWMSMVLPALRLQVRPEAFLDS